MDNLSYEEKRALLYALEEIAERYGLREFVTKDGLSDLTANWTTPYKITAEQLGSSIAVGTSPLTVVSTTVVANLNADRVDGVHASGLEPALTKGNLTAGSTKITIGGTGTGSVIGAGVSVDVAQANLDHGSIGGLGDDDHSQYLLSAGSRALSSDWDIGNGRMIQADKIRARDADGLALYEDGGAGIFVEDGGEVGIGTATPSDKLDINGNLRITGSARIIKGLFSGTYANRTLFQTYETDTYTKIHLAPSGTGIMSGFNFISKSDTANAGVFSLQVNDTSGGNGGIIFDSLKTGTGTTVPFRFTINTSATDALRIGTDGNVGVATNTPSAKLAINGGLNVGADTDPGDNNLYVVGDCSALTFTDRTKVYDGDAVKAIKAIMPKSGELDHNTMPEFMKSKYREPIYEEYEEIIKDEETGIEKTVIRTRSDKYIEKTGRNLGNTISVLLKAIQEQQVMIEELQKKVKEIAI